MRNLRCLIVVGLAVLSTNAFAQQKALTVVSWGGAYQDAQRKIYFEPFRKETGISLVEDFWDGGIGILRAKVQGGAGPWDVVQVESEELALGCDEDLFETLDFNRIGGAAAFVPEAVSPCGVGSIIYNFVLAYDRDKLKVAPTGWADFFDTVKFPGRRALRQGPKTTLEIALMADGVAPADVYKVLATPVGVDRAFKKLEGLRNNIVWWKTGAQPPQLLAAGEVVMTSVYNGRIDTANRFDRRNFGIVWRQSLYTIDSWVILKGTHNLDAAYAFLAFASRPERQALLPEAIAYGVTNKAAADLIDPKWRADLPTAPANRQEVVRISDAFWLENIDKLTERFNRWAAQ